MNSKILDKTFDDNNLDVIVSSSEFTRFWYTNIQSSAGYLFIEKISKSTLVIDSRYIEYARNEAKNVDVKLQEDNTMKELVAAKGYKRVGIEQEYLTIGELEMFKKLIPNAEFVNISGANLRAIKTKEEGQKLKAAAQLALKALENITPFVKPGVTEIEVANKLVNEMRILGAEKESFDPIVASGSNGALPHAHPTNKKIQEGELVTIDFGCILNGYCSDITRTLKIGKIKDEKLNEIYEVVKEAQSRGVKAIKPGVTTVEVDKVCRDYITEKGYGKYFVHSTGHGLGIEVHEKPNVTPRKEFDTVLEPGMVITVEPGIYIEGFGGVRIEDDILVTETGYENLSR